MSIVHYLHVGEGDCSIIEHDSGNVTVIDVCNARRPDYLQTLFSPPLRGGLSSARGVERFAPTLGALFGGDAIHSARRQSEATRRLTGSTVENPIQYMDDRGIGRNGVTRFILTGPDMDHMDGLKDLFERFHPQEFWDTDNRKSSPFANAQWFQRYREDDWTFYSTALRGPRFAPARRRVVHAGDGESSDSLQVLSPTPQLLSACHPSNEYNDASCVVYHQGAFGSVLFPGDAEQNTWQHLLSAYRWPRVDVLITPHHGRRRNQDFQFLEVLDPRMTFIGRAPSMHIAYWQYGQRPHHTNYSAGSMIVDLGNPRLPVWVTDGAYAREMNPRSAYHERFKAWFLCFIK